MTKSKFPGSQESAQVVFDSLVEEGKLKAADFDLFMRDPVSHLGGTIHSAVNSVTAILVKTHGLKNKENPMTTETKEKAPAKTKAPKAAKVAGEKVARKGAFTGTEVFESTGNVDGMRKGIGPEIAAMFDGSKKLATVVKAAEKKLAEQVKSAKFTDDPSAYVHKHVRRALDAGALKLVS